MEEDLVDLEIANVKRKKYAKELKVFEKIWERRDRVYSLYLKGVSVSKIARKLNTKRAVVWKDIRAKQFELQRMEKGDPLHTLKERLRELLTAEWRLLKHAKAPGERIEHSKLIKEIIMSLAQLSGVITKDKPNLNLFNIPGEGTTLHFNGKSIEDMDEQELDDAIRNETQEIRDITPPKATKKKSKRLK
jgi:predicted DNA-binding protein YlxM (UPF0122 family)